ncbi:MAG: KH domain-containing protein [Clostridia bacterium]|nr:KH domain-containing protein [Clostridia bacterium]
MIILKDVLADIAKAIVDNPDCVEVTEERKESGEVLLTLKVAPSDMGMVIGRHGRIAKSIRLIMKAAANSLNEKVTVDIE